MSKITSWKCEVCGYIHEGDAPPETCPKCGSKTLQTNTDDVKYCSREKCEYSSDRPDIEKTRTTRKDL